MTHHWMFLVGEKSTAFDASFLGTFDAVMWQYMKRFVLSYVCSLSTLFFVNFQLLSCDGPMTAKEWRGVDA